MQLNARGEECWENPASLNVSGLFWIYLGYADKVETKTTARTYQKQSYAMTHDLMCGVRRLNIDAVGILIELADYWEAVRSDNESRNVQ